MAYIEEAAATAMETGSQIGKARRGRPKICEGLRAN